MICYVIGEKTTDEPFDRDPLNPKYSDYLMALGAEIIKLKKAGYLRFVLCSETEFVDDFLKALLFFYNCEILYPGYLTPIVEYGGMPPEHKFEENDIIIYICDGVVSCKAL